MPACPNCASENPSGAQFCALCGAPMSASAPQAARPVATYQPVYAPRPLKDRSIALILEILPGLFGIFGIGWIYAGNTTAGILWLIGVLAWDVAAGLINVLSGGIGCLCTIPVGLGLVAISAAALNSYTKQHNELFGT
jgi:TM2 domain-containing membrane protein YozV